MNHYQVLQVNPKASQQEIKRSYRRLAKQFHPDSQPETQNCDRIIALNAAQSHTTTNDTNIFMQEIKDKMSHGFSHLIMIIHSS